MREPATPSPLSPLAHPPGAPRLQAKIAAVDSLIAKKDEEKDAALALAAAKDAEIERLKAKLAER